MRLPENVIKFRKCLIIFQHNLRNRDSQALLPDHQLYGIRFWPKIAQRVITSLTLMENLKQLFAYDLTMDQLMPLILKNATQLQVLYTPYQLPTDGAVRYPKLQHLTCSNFDANAAVACPRLQTLHLRLGYLRTEDFYPIPGVKMPCLTKLIVGGGYTEIVNIAPFMLKNASTLRSADIGWLPLPHDQKQGIVYKNLEDLSCGHLDADAAKSCPVLKRLNVYVQESGRISGLPGQHLTSINIVLDFLPEDQSLEVCRVISGMQNLKVLQLRQELEDQEPDDRHLETLPNIFQNMHQLEDLEMDVNDWRTAFEHENVIQEWIHTLAQQNHSLKRINLEGMSLTDDCLSSLSRLPILSHIHLGSNNKLTVPGILTLLRGASRAVIEELAVDHGVEDETRNRVGEEIIQIAEERGWKAVNYHDHYRITKPVTDVDDDDPPADCMQIFD